MAHREVILKGYGGRNVDAHLVLRDREIMKHSAFVWFHTTSNENVYLETDKVRTLLKELETLEAMSQ